MSARSLDDLINETATYSVTLAGVELTFRRPSGAEAHALQSFVLEASKQFSGGASEAYVPRFTVDAAKVLSKLLDHDREGAAVEVALRHTLDLDEALSILIELSGLRRLIEKREQGTANPFGITQTP